MSELSDVIKALAVNANEASQPDKVMFGKVISKKPFSVQITDKIIINENHPYFIKVRSLDLGTLNIGDTVLVLRGFGGAYYIMMDVI